MIKVSRRKQIDAAAGAGLMAIVKTRVALIVSLLLLQSSVPLFASGRTDVFSDVEALLPPAQSWSGKSEALMAR